LTFSVVSGPQGLSVDASTGLVGWTPVASQVGSANVTLRVSDGLGGTATQSYVVLVHQQPGNQPPLIVSDPVTQYNSPPASNPASGNVDPTGIDLTLTQGQTSDQTVTLHGPLAGGPLTLGSTVIGNLGTPGQQDTYTFTLATGALLDFDSLTNNSNFS